jgi:tyrosyl-tRNA synthetase
MSKSLGNYIGIAEPPQEMFGKIMSISDELMWRYYELLTDVSVGEIARMRAAAEGGGRNPRDLKVELAKRIITDFHSAAEADDAEEEFVRRFRNKEVPDEVEEIAVPSQLRKLPGLLVEIGLAPSMAEARRLIEQGGVRLNGERLQLADELTFPHAGEEAGVYNVGKGEIFLGQGQTILLQVGKRRFLRVRGE